MKKKRQRKEELRCFAAITILSFITCYVLEKDDVHVNDRQTATTSMGNRSKSREGKPQEVTTKVHQF